MNYNPRFKVACIRSQFLKLLAGFSSPVINFAGLQDSPPFFQLFNKQLALHAQRLKGLSKQIRPKNIHRKLKTHTQTLSYCTLSHFQEVCKEQQGRVGKIETLFTSAVLQARGSNAEVKRKTFYFISKCYLSVEMVRLHPWQKAKKI